MQTVRDQKGKTIKVLVNWYFLAPFIPFRDGDMFLSGKQWVKVDGNTSFPRNTIFIRNIRSSRPGDIVKDERAVKIILE